MNLTLIMTMLGYFGVAYCLTEDTVRRCKPDTQKLVRSILWVVFLVASMPLIASLLHKTPVA
jgi:hypothetical protein